MFLISCWALSVCCQTQSRSGRPWEKDWSLTLRQRCHLSTTRDRAMRDLSEYSSHTPTHTHTLVLVQLIPKASPGQLPPMCVMTHRTTNIWTVLAIVSKILAQHGGLSLMCLLLFCRSLFSSTESGNSSVLGVVKYFSVHFLHVMLNVPIKLPESFFCSFPSVSQESEGQFGEWELSGHRSTRVGPNATVGERPSKI